jgi:hypothetical protein
MGPGRSVSHLVAASPKTRVASERDGGRYSHRPWMCAPCAPAGRANGYFNDVEGGERCVLILS